MGRLGNLVLLLVSGVCVCVAVCCSILQYVAVAMGRLGYLVLPLESGVCVAVCCSVWQCVAVCRRVLQCVAVAMATGQPVAAASIKWALQCVAVCCIVLQCVAIAMWRLGYLLLLLVSRVCVCVLQCVCCSVLQCAAACCSSDVTTGQPIIPASVRYVFVCVAVCVLQRFIFLHRVVVCCSMCYRVYLCVYVYACMNVCGCTRESMYISNMYILAYICSHLYVSVCTCMYVCIYQIFFILEYICSHVYVSVCTCMYVCVHQIFTFLNTYVHICMYLYVCVCMSQRSWTQWHI